jgi:hypothetical protein
MKEVLCFFLLELFSEKYDLHFISLSHKISKVRVRKHFLFHLRNGVLEESTFKDT